MATGRDHSESKKSDEILGSHGADMMSLQLGREDSPSSFSADDFDGSGRTRRLLERVGHLQSALSCLLAPEDVSSLNDGEKAVVENGLATNHEGGSLSDLFVQQPMVRTCQNLGASLKDSLALHHATISSIDGAAADLKMMKSTSAVLSRKRKPTGSARGGEVKDAKRRGGEEPLRQHESLSPSVCSLLLESLPKVTGVFFDRSQERWVSSVYMGGRNIKSYFPVYKHGFLQARNMAISQRLSQVAHKGVSRREVDALTPPGLTVEALLEAFQSRGVSDRPLCLSAGSPRSGANAESRQKEGSQHLKEVTAKLATESPRASICSKSTSSPVSCNAASPRVGTISAQGGNNLSPLASPSLRLTSDVPMLGGGGTTPAPSLFSSLHLYAALELCPWEKGITWGSETFSWTVQCARSSDRLRHVPVRLAERHKQTLQAVGHWSAGVGDTSKCAKLALELRRAARLRACKMQREEVLEAQQANGVEASQTKRDEFTGQVTGAGDRRPHADERRSLESILPSLVESGEGRDSQELDLRNASDVKEEWEARNGDPTLVVGVDKLAMAPEVEEAAGALFQAVGEAYAEAIILARRSDEVASDEELLSALEDRCGAEGAVLGNQRSADGGDSDEEFLLSVPRPSKKKDVQSGSVRGAPHADNRKSTGMAKRALMTRAAVALKPWPQGVSWASSSGRWFAVARLPSGARVARTFHPSTKGGVEEAYRLACDFLRRIKDDPVAFQTDPHSLNKQSSASSRRLLTSRSESERDLLAALPDLQHGQDNMGSHSQSSLIQSLTQRWHTQLRPLHNALYVDKLLPVDLEGLAAMEACCRADEGTPEALSCGSSPNSGRCLLSDRGFPRNGSGKWELAPFSGDQQTQTGNAKELDTRDNELTDSVQLCNSGGTFASCSPNIKRQVLSHIAGEELQVEDGEAQVLSLQQEAVRRCLLDLRELSSSLFSPHVREQKVATVDAHLALVSSARALQHLVVYLQLFESALFGGQLPSRMLMETQRVFFGALDALAGALKLQNG